MPAFIGYPRGQHHRSDGATEDGEATDEVLAIPDIRLGPQLKTWRLLEAWSGGQANFRCASLCNPPFPGTRARRRT